MTGKPTYRWEIRRDAKARKENFGGAISSHDLVILAVIIAMLVIVIRIILIFGVTQGMELGPFSTDIESMPYEPSPYVNLPSVNESFHQLKYISGALFLYWLIASWKSFSSKTVTLSTKLFKTILGVSIVVLFAGSFFPENAFVLIDLFPKSEFSPQPLDKIHAET